jgi:penicillin-binding protein 1C
VLGWVGSRDFSDAAHAGQIDGVLVRRQSASTLKPFLYACAIARGWTAATLLPDAPLAFGADEQEVYRPENFDKRSHGAIRLRTALASSLNVPAVYALSHLGLPTFLETLGKLGFRLPADARARWGLGAAIGNAEVSLVELARAFSVFPRGGTLPALRLLEGQGVGSSRVFDPFSAWMICDILSDPSARATGFGTRTYFRTSYPAMFKSGTSSEFTNLWCVGATPRFTVAAWAGNFDGRAVINKTGSIVPAQIVVDVLDRLTEAGSTQPGFEPPSGVVEARICAISGQRATPSCPSTRKEFFRSANEVPDLCAYHASAGDRASLLLESFLAPSQRIRILFPVNGQVFYLDQTAGTAPQGVPVVIAARRGLEVAVGIDGAVPTRVASLSQIRVPLRRGAHHVVVRSGGSEERVTFEVR